MLKIRLRRVGRKNEPHYQMVVAPHTNPVKSNYICKLGWYNPTTKDLQVDKELVLSWLNKGAQPSDRVAKLLVSQKISHPAIKVISRPPRPPKKEKKDDGKKTIAPQTDEQSTEVTTEKVDGQPAITVAAATKDQEDQNNNQKGDQPQKDNEEVR
jgi:small subunit ribosomal protein S16